MNVVGLAHPDSVNAIVRCAEGLRILLLAAGKSVLLVDTDGLKGSLTHLYHQEKAALHDIDDSAFRPVEVAPGLGLLPARVTVSKGGTIEAVQGVLETVIDRARDKFDYLILCAPPGDSRLAWLVVDLATVCRGTLASDPDWIPYLGEKLLRRRTGPTPLTRPLQPSFRLAPMPLL